MTQLQPAPATDRTASLDSLLRNARDRSARGNATRRDWERVAAIDADRARRELRQFLRHHASTTPSRANPYERRRAIPGAVLGFLAGVALMVVIWIILPYARENWMERSVMRDIATGGQFLSTLFVPIGMLLGARWDHRRHGTNTEPAPGMSREASFEELLDAFEQTQHVGRARIY